MNVMIAEDDYHVAGIHEKFLQQLQDIHVVAKAQTANETIQLVNRYQPDLVLLDVYLPDQLGVDVVEQLYEVAPHVQIILITAATEKDIFTEALHLGVIDYLIKPIAFERLKEAIEKAQAQSKQLKQSPRITQALADSFFLRVKDNSDKESELPKGIDRLTLEKVRHLLSKQQDGITAEALGKEFGASRTTSRRYLEYLISIDEAKAELEYGIVGRPERKYWKL
ncbi:transcriptional regulator [Alkalicoccobacillus plakortidis]|uniref:Transcriptional regulator n=2 Tax=Bacillaceae TaxID=186817 RepID=A0A9D5I1Y5_9BACI|nr:response regulator [Shouchella oshimensis]KQL58746.1 transcriptional regulator [Alkalicoccobacillus plakortidis]RQW18786.1 response regulator [Bacillus sp. C1-1]